MAEKFVQPLIKRDINSGHYSSLICDNNKCNYNTQQIKFKIKISNFIYIFLYIIYIAAWLKSKKITHVFIHNSSTAMVPMLASKLMNIKNIIYFNHGVPHIGYKGINKFILLFIEKINCLNADHIITVSNDMKNELNKVTKKKVNLIYNGSASGIDLTIFNKKRYKKSKIKQKLNIFKNSFIIVYVGRIEDRKGFNFLMEIWEHYFKNDKNYTLLICGNNTKNMSGTNVKYLGFIDNVPEILSVSDCLILPSKHEGLPYAILESLACECPVIASDIPGTTSIIKNNTNGILIKNFNTNEYYQKIVELKKNSDFRNKIIKNGLATSKKYDRLKFLRSYTNLFDNVLS